MEILLDAFIKGIALGLALAFSVGPGFFTLLQTSLEHGVKVAISLAFGIFLSDTACVFMAYYGASKFMSNPNSKLYIGIIGGTILLIFGIYNIVKKKSLTEESTNPNIKITKPNMVVTILKGFFINILNPFVILLWLGWVGIISSNEDYKDFHVLVFFTTTLSTVLCTDILKAFAASKIKKFLQPKMLVLLNRILGIIMIVCGIYMLARVMPS